MNALIAMRMHGIIVIIAATGIVMSIMIRTAACASMKPLIP